MPTQVEPSPFPEQQSEWELCSLGEVLAWGKVSVMGEDGLGERLAGVGLGRPEGSRHRQQGQKVWRGEQARAGWRGQGAVMLVGAETREVSQRKAGTRRALCHLVFILFCFNTCIDF